MNTNKVIGSIFIVVGTTMGAGMLALPMISASSGFTMAALLLLAIWALMTTTALLTLEANLAFKKFANSFGTMAKHTFGLPGQIISWLCTLLLLYSLTAAYITGSASLLTTNVFALIWHTQISNSISALLFVLLMGGIVFWSTKSIDYCNRIFLSLKGVLLFIVLVLLAPQITITNLTATRTVTNPQLFSMLAIFICSFGFHTVIPSLSNYVGRKPRELKTIIVSGALIILGIYLSWLLVTMGVVPWLGKYSFSAIKNPNDVGAFIKTIYVIVNSRWVTLGINLFANVAMTTSFLGVALSLFDFLADGFNRPNTRWGRVQTALLTFTPPVTFAIFFPNGFIWALKYAAFFVTMLIILAPPLMVYKLRKNPPTKALYTVFGGNYLLVFLIITGVIILSLQIVAAYTLP